MSSGSAQRRVSFTVWLLARTASQSPILDPFARFRPPNGRERVVGSMIDGYISRFFPDQEIFFPRVPPIFLRSLDPKSNICRARFFFHCGNSEICPDWPSRPLPSKRVKICKCSNISTHIKSRHRHRDYSGGYVHAGAHCNCERCRGRVAPRRIL